MSWSIKYVQLRMENARKRTIAKNIVYEFMCSSFFQKRKHRTINFITTKLQDREPLLGKSNLLLFSGVHELQIKN